MKKLKKENKNVLCFGLLSLYITTAGLMIFIPATIYNGISKEMLLIIIFFISAFLLPFLREIKESFWLIRMYINKRYLIKYGKKLEIKINKIENLSFLPWRTRNLNFERRTYARHYYRIIGKWIQDETQMEYIFKSDFYNLIIKENLNKRDKIIVYINEKNPKKYYVAIDESIENKYKKLYSKYGIEIDKK